MSVAEDKNFVGLTPLRLELDPGVYALAIGSDENPIDSGPDGETNRIEVLDGNGGFVPAYKQYSLTKVEGKVAILISVFYPKEQGIKQLLTSLPKEDLFDSPKLTEGAFSENFIRYGVPKVLWQDLVAMFQKTGKFYWSGTSATEYMLEQWISLDRLGNPKEIGIQPVKE